MQKNTYLVDAQKMLKKQGYYTVFRDSNILEMCFNKQSMPFAFLVIEDEQFPGIIISFASDFHEVMLASDITITLMHIIPIAVGEPFYIDKSGNTYWGEEAEIRFSFETNPEWLEKSGSPSKELH